MKKFFITLAITMMFMITGCTCGRQTEPVVDEAVVETVDSVAVDVLEIADSTLVAE